jgi:hypothetical protein
MHALVTPLLIAFMHMQRSPLFVVDVSPSCMFLRLQGRALCVSLHITCARSNVRTGEAPQQEVVQ